MKEPLVYIIILNWNGYKDTIECIESLEKITYKNYKIVLVDNASTDNSVRMLKARFPKLRIITNDVNLGFSGGSNIGIKYAMHKNADYILLLNNDTTVHRHFLSELIEIGEKNEDIGILSPFIYYSDKPRAIWSSGLVLNIKSGWPFYDFNKSKIDSGQFEKLHFVDYLTGCSMLIKRKVIEKLGYFRDEYFIYVEDMDFSLRAIRNDFLLCSVPQSKAWHKIGQASKLEGEKIIRYYITRNLILFFKYNFPIKDYFIYSIHAVIWYFLEAFRYRNDVKIIYGILTGIVHGHFGITGSYFNKYENYNNCR